MGIQNYSALWAKENEIQNYQAPGIVGRGLSGWHRVCTAVDKW